MVADELIYQIKNRLRFVLTHDQDAALVQFCAFLVDRSAINQPVMILRGSAGTGKTSLAGAIVRTMIGLKQKVMLLAPTGRAAKVFSQNSEHAAFTIHRKIYRQRSFSGDGGQFNLNDNLHTDTLFLIDEASMIANEGYSGATFGSGRLLDDLIKYVYSGRNCRMLLVGDKAQLPPVGEIESPALSDLVLAGYGLNVYSSDLDEVVRQGEGSGILLNATVIRKMITSGDGLSEFPRIRFGFPDIIRVGGDELIESINSSYSQVGIDETIVITRSNKRANIYNHGLRNTVLDREEELTTGDMLMIVKNNYYWTERAKAPIDFIANGDRAQVRRVRNIREMYGFRFADVILSFPDYDNYELQATVLINSLSTDAPALTREENEQLYNKVMEDYSDIPQKAERLKKLKQDDYFNAIQVKFAYAITCHKAQGGQWEHVYLDQGYITNEMLSPDYIRWLYTAFTRARERLFMVNWRNEQTEEG